MTPVQFHEFDWLPEDALNGRTSLPKTSMLASMPAGKGDVTLIHKNIRSAWVLSLRPDNVGIPAYKNEQCSYNELLVIHAELSEKANSSGIVRLQEMFHRSIPYPLFLWLAHGPAYFLSAVPLRHNRAEKGKEVWENPITKVRSFELVPAFKAALHPSFSHTANLRDLYIRWIRSLYGLMIHSLPWTELMGNPQPFFLPDTIEAGTRAWGSLSTLFEEWKSLNSRLNKERQPNHRVTLGNKRFDVREQILSLAASLPFRAFPE